MGMQALFNRTRQDPVLDRPLQQFSGARMGFGRSAGRDPWTVRDACEGVQIFGAVGSGKTSGSGASIAMSYLEAGMGGLVLCAKTDERATWERYCERAGRSDDLVVFGIGRPHRFNFLEYESGRSQGLGGEGSGGLTENTVQLITTLREIQGRGNGSGGGDADGAFWTEQLKSLLRNAVDLAVLAGVPLSLSVLDHVVRSAPKTTDEIADPGWQADSACLAMLRAAEQRAVSHADRKTLRAVAAYWMDKYPSQPDRTQASIVTMFDGLLDGFLRGPLAELFDTTTTVTPEDTFAGKVIVLDLPVKSVHEIGLMAQVLWKQQWQRAVEARDTEACPNPVFLWADEAHNFVTAQDREFLATARSSRACTVLMTQNLPNYYAAIGGPDPKSPTKALLGCLGTKIFHANGCDETNLWASEVIAKSWRSRATLGSTDPGKGGDGQPGQTPQQGSTSTSLSSSHDNQVDPLVFATLAKGGPKGITEAIVTRVGEPWNATGANWIRCRFRQAR